MMADLRKYHHFHDSSSVTLYKHVKKVRCQCIYSNKTLLLALLWAPLFDLQVQTFLMEG